MSASNTQAAGTSEWNIDQVAHLQTHGKNRVIVPAMRITVGARCGDSSFQTLESMKGPWNVFQKTGHLWWEEKLPLSLYKRLAFADMGRTEWCSSQVEFWSENEHEFVGCVPCVYGVGRERGSEKESPAWLILWLHQEYWEVSLTGSSVLAGGRNSLSRFLWRRRVGLSGWYSIKWWHYDGQWVSEK